MINAKKNVMCEQFVLAGKLPALSKIAHCLKCSFIINVSKDLHYSYAVGLMKC